MDIRAFETLILIEPQVVKEPAGEDEYIGFFEGIASSPEVDLEGDRFLPEVLQRNAGNLRGKPILLVHGRDPGLRGSPVGRIIEAWVENGLLKIRAGIFRKFGKIWESIKNGALRALSIGGIIRKVRRDGDVNVIEDAEIREVSLAPRGVNPSAKIIKIFGKCFEIDEELGFLREIMGAGPSPGTMNGPTLSKADMDLPIVLRERWSADEARERIFRWAEREDGTIDRGKASKLFLLVEGDGSRRGDYGWPIGDVVDGEPVLVTSGIMAAIRYASRTDFEVPKAVREALERIVERMKREGLLPDDYVVPWRRDKSAVLTRIDELAERVERLERAVYGVDEAVGFRKSVGGGKSLATSDEQVRKADAGPVELSRVPVFRELYRRLYGAVSD